MTRVEPSGERLAANVVHFARLLRRAGLRIGPGDTLDAQRAVAAVDIVQRDQFYWALHAVLVRRRADHALFDEAFRLFWRDPMGVHSALSLLLPQVRTPVERSVSRRLSEAWRPPPRAPAAAPPAPEQPPQVDTFLAYSADEVLRTRDFDQMSADELARARAVVRRFELDVRPLVTRRTRPARRGEIDRARTIRSALRGGGELVALRHRDRIVRPPAIVALCDISGSMGRYSEMLLRFLHALLAEHGR
ncbi:MAG TPA: VWA domain-containing protein, partial [Kofleriaceae bacterium]|nr:VWA domain-containing protein [Kofleriaceae bacterium]